MGTFLQPSSLILRGVADRFWSVFQSAPNPIPCNLPESKDFLQESGGKASGRGSNPTEGYSKDLEGEREINSSLFQEEG